MFHSKINNYCSIEKIFMGYVEWTFRHPHIKYLSNQMNLKFSHKLA